jgi:type VI secretion system VasD/TssJ family lipoprotein
LRTRRRFQTWILAAASLPLLLVGSCAVIRHAPLIGKPGICLDLRASPDLNFFAGQPHVLRLWLYPLDDELGFQQADVEDLLAGRKPAGAGGDPIELRIAPAERRRIDQPLPTGARSIGLVADYYRGPEGEGGARRLVVNGHCHTILLSKSEVKLQ